MVSIDSETLKIQQVTLEQQTCQTQAVSKENKQETPIEPQSDVAKISKQALSEINSLISSEDSLVLKTNLAQEAYNYLSDMRLQLGVLRDGLKDTELTNDIEILKMFDDKSNEIIDNIISTMRKHDFSNYVDINFTNIMLDGLNSLKSLNIADNNYLLNLNNLMASVTQKEKDYYNLQNELNSNTIEHSKKYDDLLDNQNNTQKQISSSELKENIIKDAEETITSVTQGLTPEVVLRLLQG